MNCNVANRTLYSVFRFRLIVGFGLITVLLALLVVWKVYSEYAAARAAAFTQTGGFARAMSAHVLSEMRVAEVSLLRAAEAIDDLAPVDLARPERIRVLLASSASVSDTHFWIHFIDTKGVGVAASNGLPILGVSFADQPYFAPVQGKCDGRAFVGAPDRGRVSKRPLFFVSRAVCSPTGNFLGVLVAQIDASAIAQMFTSARFTPSLSITLMHAEGRVIARSPLFETAFATDIRSSSLYQHWKSAPAGSYISRGLLDGEDRVFSYQTVDNLPLVVSVGVTTKSMIDAIQKASSVALGSLLVLGIAFWFGGRYALRSFRSLESSEARQRELNLELANARDEMAKVVQRARTIADSLPALIAYVDSSEHYIFHNSNYRHLPGVDLESMQGKTLREALGERFYAMIAPQVRRVLAGERVSFDRSIMYDSQERHMRFDYTPDRDLSGKIVGFYTMAVDVTNDKKLEAVLSDQARKDSLTGLPNRYEVYARLGDALARSRRSDIPIACLYLDIDHFKSINDSLGHAAGDDALKQFGARLRASVRETDLVARLAGDEFIIVLEGIEQPIGARIVADKIIAAMQSPLTLTGMERSLTTSIGIAVSAGDDENADSLLRKADAALYKAKREGRGKAVNS